MPEVRMHDILVIDDDEMMIAIITAILEDGPYTIRSAMDGQQGIAEVALRRPDLILLDMQMPVLDGFAVARSLAAMPACATIPIVAVTGDADAEGRRAALGAGCCALVAKPIDATTLLACVEGLLH